MTTRKFTFLVIENAPDVCDGIIRRMASFPRWESIGYCIGVKEAGLVIDKQRPNLIFLDWSLNGGSAYELLQQMQNIQNYDPYIIFNTGFQRDNPEIPQEIFNRYRVDKYLVKPLWEHLRKYLPDYLKEAEEKACKTPTASKVIWLEDESGIKWPVSVPQIICICQHPSKPRCRTIYLNNSTREITASLQWNKCYELLEKSGVDFFVTKSRAHLIIRDHIEKFDKPFIRLRNFPAKIEVVKENIRNFETWLTSSQSLKEADNP